jgi:hypothetical protein
MFDPLFFGKFVMCVVSYIHDVYHFDNPISVALKHMGESILRVNHFLVSIIVRNKPILDGILWLS